MGKKSRRNKAAKPPRAPDTPDTADDQDWWINGEAVPEADFVARTYEEIVSDPNHNDYPLAERHAAAGLAPLKRRPERVKKRRPSCDVCGAENARYTCIGCGSQHYCGKDCQKYAWREDGHRDECKTLQDVSDELKTTKRDLAKALKDVERLKREGNADKMSMGAEFQKELDKLRAENETYEQKLREAAAREAGMRESLEREASERAKRHAEEIEALEQKCEKARADAKAAERAKLAEENRARTARLSAFPP